MTPPGRLQAMTQRLQATSDAVGTVKPALDAFYTSLTDEQKARFNEIGPQLGEAAAAAADRRGEQRPEPSQANCSSEKAGLSNIAIDRIEDSVQPTTAQEAALDRLDEAMQKAVEILRDACPNTIPMTPVGRLEVMKQRLDAMIAGGQCGAPGAGGLLRGAQRRAEGEVQPARPADRAIGRLTAAKTGARRAASAALFVCGAIVRSKFSRRGVASRALRPGRSQCYVSPLFGGGLRQYRCGESISASLRRPWRSSTVSLPSSSRCCRSGGRSSNCGWASTALVLGIVAVGAGYYAKHAGRIQAEQQQADRNAGPRADRDLHPRRPHAARPDPGRAARAAGAAADEWAQRSETLPARPAWRALRHALPQGRQRSLWRRRDRRARAWATGARCATAWSIWS